VPTKHTNIIIKIVFLNFGVALNLIRDLEVSGKMMRNGIIGNKYLPQKAFNSDAPTPVAFIY